MPIYEFQCPACRAEFEELVLRRGADALAGVTCPKCGAGNVVRRMSAFAAKVNPRTSSASARSAGCAPGG